MLETLQYYTGWVQYFMIRGGRSTVLYRLGTVYNYTGWVQYRIILGGGNTVLHRVGTVHNSTGWVQYITIQVGDYTVLYRDWRVHYYTHTYFMNLFNDAPSSSLSTRYFKLTPYLLYPPCIQRECNTVQIQVHNFRGWGQYSTIKMVTVQTYFTGPYRAGTVQYSSIPPPPCASFYFIWVTLFQ